MGSLPCLLKLQGQGSVIGLDLVLRQLGPRDVKVRYGSRQVNHCLCAQWAQGLAAQAEELQCRKEETDADRVKNQSSDVSTSIEKEDISIVSSPSITT